MGFLCAFPRAEIGTIVIAIQIVIGHAGTSVTKMTTTQRKVIASQTVATTPYRRQKVGAVVLVSMITTVATSTQEPGRHITTTQRSDPVDSGILLIGHSLIRAMLGVLRDI